MGHEALLTVAECSYAYNDGTRDCEKKTILPRKSVGDLTDQEWRDYVAVLKLIKFNPARYVVSTKNFTTDLELVLESMIHIVVGIGDLATGTKIPFKDAGPFAFVSFSPNDPIFPNHHTMVDCLFEQWLQRYKDSVTYPDSPLIRDDHRADDYIVLFIELFKQMDMFKMAENFGYSCPQFHAKHYNSTNNNI